MKKRLNDNNQIRIGAVISYVLIIVNALYGVVFSPFILNSIGDSSYGVYKTVASLSSALMVLDLGIGGTVMRYIAKFRTDGEEDKINSFVSMAMCEGFGLVLIISAIFAVLVGNMESIYGNSFSPSEMELATKLLIILSINVVFQIIGNILNGIVTGFNNFIVGNGLKLGRVICRMVLVLALLSNYRSAVALAYINLFISITAALIELFIVLFVYHIRPNLGFHSWDKYIFRESSVYTLLLFLTSVVAQVNNNLDNILIGAIKGASFVTVYSFGLLIFSMFEQLSTAISQVMLPTVTKALKKPDGMNSVQNIIVSTGRVQFALLGAATVGFAILGKQFVSLWLGQGFEDVYVIVMILMIPSTLELCVNVCLSVLRAKNKLVFRTCVILATTVLNFIVTFFGVTYFNYIAAAVGTAISFIVGSVIVMNIYYYKEFGFPMLRIYGKIFNRIWLCLMVSGIAVLISSRFLTEGWFAFAANVLIFVIIYGATMLLFGFKKEEWGNCFSSK